MTFSVLCFCVVAFAPCLGSLPPRFCFVCGSLAPFLCLPGSSKAGCTAPFSLSDLPACVPECVRAPFSSACCVHACVCQGGVRTLSPVWAGHWLVMWVPVLEHWFLWLCVSVQFCFGFTFMVRVLLVCSACIPFHAALMDATSVTLYFSR